MQYRVREGIIKLKICGKAFLAPTRKAFDYCYPIIPLNIFNSIIWQMLSNGQSVDEIYNVFEQMFVMSKNDGTKNTSFRDIVDKYLRDFIDKGYVIEKEELM